MDTPDQGTSTAHILSADQAPTGGRPSGAQGLTMEQAAAELGVSLMTVRRRVKDGALAAERVQGKYGPEWRVYLEAPPVVSTDQPASAARNGAQNGAQGYAHRGKRSDALTDGRIGAQSTDHGLIAALRESQATTARLIAENTRLQDERAELFGRLGFYQAQLQQAQETIKALEAPKEPPPSPPPPAGAVFRPLPAEPEPPQRPWWRFW